MAYSASNQKHIYHQGVATTDATVTTIKTLPIKFNSVAYVTAIVTAIRTGGSSGTLSDSAVYHLEQGVKNSSGTAVLLGPTVTPNAVEDQAAWDAAFSVSGGNLLLRVTGAASNNITWNAKIEVIENV